MYKRLAPACVLSFGFGRFFQNPANRKLDASVRFRHYTSNCAAISDREGYCIKSVGSAAIGFRACNESSSAMKYSTKVSFFDRADCIDQLSWHDESGITRISALIESFRIHTA
jgi:hypothetical protein